MFASVGSLAAVVPGAGFTELLTTRMASACPLSIINGSGWLLQNSASVCGPRLRVLLVCLLELAIFHVFQRILRMFSKFAYQALIRLTFGYSGDAMVAREEFLLPTQRVLGMFFRSARNLRDTPSFAILPVNTTPFPFAQNTS